MPIFVTVTPGTTVTSSTTLDAATLNLLGTPSVQVEGTVDGGSLTIGSGSVLLTSLAAQADQTVVGNGSGSSASPVALTLSGLTATSTTLSISNSAITTAKLDARAVTAAKLFAVDGTTTAKLLGRYTTGSGDVETLTVGSNLNVTGGTLNTLRPRTAFTNFEAATTYTISNDRANAVTLSDLSTTITPQTNTSKVLVQFNISCEVFIQTAFILERVDGATVTPLGVPATPVNRIYGTKVAPFDGENSSTQFSVAISFLDSPASINSITYRIRAYGSAASATLAVNRSITDTNNSNFSRSTSQVILQEILPT
jgi:hypothetical protein